MYRRIFVDRNVFVIRQAELEWLHARTLQSASPQARRAKHIKTRQLCFQFIFSHYYSSHTLTILHCCLHYASNEIEGSITGSPYQLSSFLQTTAYTRLPPPCSCSREVRTKSSFLWTRGIYWMLRGPDIMPPDLTDTLLIDGRKERVQFDKITARVSRLCYGLDPEHVDAAAITQKVISGVYQGVTTVELDNLVCCLPHLPFNANNPRLPRLQHI